MVEKGDQRARRPEDDLAERDRAAEADDQYAHARDVEAEDDDQEAAARDVAAAERDADAENRDSEAEADRARSDRREAAEDRQQAAEDRDRARGDRITAQQQRRRAGDDRGVAHDAVAQLMGLLVQAEDNAEAMWAIAQAQGRIMIALEADPLDALLELADRAARDSCDLHDAAQIIMKETAPCALPHPTGEPSCALRVGHGGPHRRGDLEWAAAPVHISREANR